MVWPSVFRIPTGRKRPHLGQGRHEPDPSWFPDSDQNRMKVTSKTLPAMLRSTPSMFKLNRLFTDKDQLKHSNAMPVISPQGDRIAFISNRSGEMRVWVSALDGSGAKLSPSLTRPTMRRSRRRSSKRCLPGRRTENGSLIGKVSR